MKIGIVYDRRKEKAVKHALRAGDELLSKRGLDGVIRSGEVLVSLKAEAIKDFDFYLVFGGDGLLLHIADLVAPFGIPLLGINYGYKGCLCKVKPEELKEKLEKVLTEDYRIEKRTRVLAKIFSKGTLIQELDALNEIVIGGINKTVWLQVSSKFFEAETRGDGILVATRTGSTAYNVRAGGSVFFTEEYFSLVAICGSFDSPTLLPETKAMAVPSSTAFRIESLHKTKANLPWVTADGQRQYRLKEEEFVLIGKSKHKTLLIDI